MGALLYLWKRQNELGRLGADPQVVGELGYKAQEGEEALLEEYHVLAVVIQPL